jgi:CheY-like chemotaxis protein
MSDPASQADDDAPRPALAGRRVLIVDDDEALRAAAFDILDPHGCEVVAVVSGSKALAVIAQRGACGAFDAMLASLRLPDMTGLELMRQLQAMDMPVPLGMLISFGYDSMALLAPARKMGLRELIYKPLIRRQVLDAIERLAAPPPGFVPFAAAVAQSTPP